MATEKNPDKENYEGGGFDSHAAPNLAVNEEPRDDYDSSDPSVND